MFIQASRYTVPNQEAADKGHQLYEQKARAMWMKAGAHSTGHYHITDGDYKGQHMVVVRFENNHAWQHGREAIREERETLLKEVEEAGIKLEDVMLLDEVA